MQKSVRQRNHTVNGLIFTLVPDDVSGTFSAERSDGARFEGLDPFGPCAVCKSTEERDVRLALYNGEPAIVCERCCDGGSDA